MKPLFDTGPFPEPALERIAAHRELLHHLAMQAAENGSAWTRHELYEDDAGQEIDVSSVDPAAAKGSEGGAE